MKSIQNLPASGSGIGSDQAIFRILNQALTFTNLVATVSDARITANDAVLTYYADASVAEAAGIVATWTTGTVTFTAATAPASTVIVSIYVIKPALANVWDSISASEVSYGASTVAAALDSKVDTAGTGLVISGPRTISTFVPRYGTTVDAKPGVQSFEIVEYVNFAPNVPTADFYHVLTVEGGDSRYATQLAIGMTTDQIFYRRCDMDTWGSWNELALKSDLPTQNKMVSYATIDSYDSASNKYTCPSDGYIYLSNSTNANDGGVFVSGSDDINFLIMGGNKGYFPLFVRKGMKCYCYGNIEHVYFFPLS